MKHYIYKGKAYKNEQTLRQAIWDKEHKIFGDINPSALDVVVEEFKEEPTQEQLTRYAREKRDRLLEKSDYFVMPDYPSSENDLAEVKAYRQALRDITKQENFPNKIDWPVTPEVL